MADNGSTAFKRKANTAFLPNSFTSYLMGALRVDLNLRMTRIQQDCELVASKENSESLTKQLLEEMFRYLYLLAGSSADGVVRSSPSYFVGQALQCLMMDPVLYWKVCDIVLNMQGRDADDVPMRVLPHDAFSGKGVDEGSRKARYDDTVVQYKETFSKDAPIAVWGDYKVLTSKATEAGMPAASTASPKKEKGLNDKVKLRVACTNDRSLDMEMPLSEKFSGIVDYIAQAQQLYSKQVELTYRNMTLRGYMTPYNLNMKDGDVIECNIPLYSAKERAEKAAAAASSLGATVTVTPLLPLANASRFAARAAPRNLINDDIDAAGPLHGNVATEETAHAMGIKICSNLMVRFVDADQNITCMVARDGAVTMGEIFDAYARCRGFWLANCLFRLRGGEVYPNWRVSSVRLGPGACIRCLKADRLITIRLMDVDNGGEETNIVTKMNVLLFRTLETYAEQKGLKMRQIRFSFKDKRVGFECTPETLRMKNNDRIDVEPNAFPPYK